MASLEQGPQQQHEFQRDIINMEKTITIRHPGYPNEFGQNIMFRLFAFDSNNGTPGLHYRTALLACAIVADNAWEGFFKTRQGDEYVVHKASQMLSPDHDYYFDLPGQHPEPYPIVPSFVHWVFPHDALPSEFIPPTPIPFSRPPGAPTTFSTAVTGRDGNCRLSDYQDDIEAAHLVPRGEAEWFKANAMGEYRRNKTLVGGQLLDDAGNGIALRKDIHACFDRKSFAIVPKNDQWVVHFFSVTHDHGPKHHNQPIKNLRDVHPAFLLARLAWTVFPLLGEFLERQARRLRYRVSAKDNRNETIETKNLFAQEIAELFETRGRSGNPRKTPSPTKRKRGSNPEDMQKDSQSLAETTSTEASRCYKVARTDSGYVEWEGNDGDDETYSHPSITYQALPDNGQAYSSASFRTIQLPSDNTFDRIYPDDLLYYSRNPVAEQAARHNARLRSLIRKHLKAQRPCNPDLLCCDYNQAEWDIAHGIPPPERLGGGRLCALCAGVDYWPPMEILNVALDQDRGGIEGLEDVKPGEMTVVKEAEREANTMAWIQRIVY